MLPVLPFKSFAILAVLLAAAPLLADDEVAEAEEDKGQYSEEPCGKLAGKPVFYHTRTEHFYGTRHNEVWINHCAIGFRTISKGKSGPDTAYDDLLSWTVVGGQAEIQAVRTSARHAKKGGHSLTSRPP